MEKQEKKIEAKLLKKHIEILERIEMLLKALEEVLKKE